MLAERPGDRGDVGPARDSLCREVVAESVGVTRGGRELVTLGDLAGDARHIVGPVGHRAIGESVVAPEDESRREDLDPGELGEHLAPGPMGDELGEDLGRERDRPGPVVFRVTLDETGAPRAVSAPLDRERPELDVEI